MRKITLSMITLLCGLLLFTACKQGNKGKLPRKGKISTCSSIRCAMISGPITKAPSLKWQRWVHGSRSRRL